MDMIVTRRGAHGDGVISLQMIFMSASKARCDGCMALTNAACSWMCSPNSKAKQSIAKQGKRKERKETRRKGRKRKERKARQGQPKKRKVKQQAAAAAAAEQHETNVGMWGAEECDIIQRSA